MSRFDISVKEIEELREADTPSQQDTPVQQDTAPEGELPAVASEGTWAESDSEILNRLANEPGGLQFAAIRRGVIQGFDPFGITLMLSGQQRKDEERVLRSHFPGTYHTSEILTALAPALLTGGAFLAPKILSKIVGQRAAKKIVKRISQAAPVAQKVFVQDVLVEKAAKKVLGEVGSSSTARKAAIFGTQAAAFSVGEGLKAEVIGERPLTAESMATNMLLSTLFAGAAGTAISKWADKISKESIKTTQKELGNALTAEQKAMRDAGIPDEPSKDVIAVLDILDWDMKTAKKWLSTAKGQQDAEELIDILTDSKLTREASQAVLGRETELGEKSVFPAWGKKFDATRRLKLIYKYLGRQREEILEIADTAPTHKEAIAKHAQNETAARKKYEGDTSDLAEAQEELAYMTDKKERLDLTAREQKIERQREFDSQTKAFNEVEDMAKESKDRLQGLISGLKAEQLDADREILLVQKAIDSLSGKTITGKAKDVMSEALSVLGRYDLDASMLEKLDLRRAGDGSLIRMGSESAPTNEQLSAYVLLNLKSTKKKLMTAKKEVGIGKKQLQQAFGDIEVGIPRPKKGSVDLELQEDISNAEARVKELKQLIKMMKDPVMDTPVRNPDSTLVRMHSVADRLNDMKIQKLNRVEMRAEAEALLKKSLDPKNSKIQRNAARNKLNEMLEGVNEQYYNANDLADIRQLQNMVDDTRQRGDAFSYANAERLKSEDWAAAYKNPSQIDELHHARATLLNEEIGEGMESLFRRLAADGVEGYTDGVAEKFMKQYRDANRKFHLLLPLADPLTKAAQRQLDSDPLGSITKFDALAMVYSPKYLLPRLGIGLAEGMASKRQPFANIRMLRRVQDARGTQRVGQKVLELMTDISTLPSRTVDAAVLALGNKKSVPALMRLSAKYASEDPISTEAQKNDKLMLKAYGDAYRSINERLTNLEDTIEAMKQSAEILRGVDEISVDMATTVAAGDLQYLVDNVLTKTIGPSGNPLPSSEEVDRLNTAHRVLTQPGYVLTKAVEGELTSFEAEVWRARRPEEWQETYTKIMDKLGSPDKEQSEEFLNGLTYAQKLSLETLFPGISLTFGNTAAITGAVQQNVFSPDDRTAKMGQDQLDMGARAATEF